MGAEEEEREEDESGSRQEMKKGRKRWRSR